MRKEINLFKMKSKKNMKYEELEKKYKEK